MHDYCLSQMGITQWLPRDNEQTKPYLVILDEQRDEAKDQLLERLLLAIGWKGIAEIQNTPSRQSMSKSQKVIIFGEDLAKRLNLAHPAFVVIPTLFEMSANPEAKKSAWMALKRFIGI